MATLKQMQAKLKKLQAQTEKLIAKRAQAVLDDIRALMERHGLTTADIDRHGKKAKRAGKPQVAYPAPAGRHEAMTKLAKKGKLPAKYRNPKTGETWSGWARPPAWIANVKDRSKFLIDAESAENAVKPKAVARKAAAKKTAAKKKAAAPAARKSVAAKPAVEPAVKRSAPRKRAAKAALPEQGGAETSPSTTTGDASV
ncbi:MULTISPECIES: H-NS histone family protein [Caballeronia]|jgi:DNA-binding protein H-NS|uniref:Histidine biosynthesis protein n=1 Tax=Caballeronia zhejiangensis TaxID=871203 RepID=A0A656QK32_9BURK|nr:MULTISPECIES: H-NS histone family protein [Caballeronia]EKS66873.1 histone family protein nucleoid-structuring protein H-NS [Burkholderia sp. SJ98]KDR30633.1 histidine biosynthesis protein [Caballeronia zhejiangensis]MCG7402166.1 H-NS histone family protein [Caballeronia zhejiangensis]MCI1042428.1 H-NS histone family protein [Caballeronia zhejiangensis]MDR5789846.1 H-NS histone family protein [Caballeronia sp. LP003]